MSSEEERAMATGNMHKKLGKIRRCGFFTVRRYANAVYAVFVSVSLHICVCLTHSGIVSKWLNVGSRK